MYFLRLHPFTLSHLLADRFQQASYSSFYFRNILLNYAVYNKGAGYTQGMSDLLAPVLVEMKNEADAFWCFVGLMQRASFVCTPTDGDMDRSLVGFCLSVKL